MHFTQRSSRTTLSLTSQDFARQNRRANSDASISFARTLFASLILVLALSLSLTSCASGPIQHPGALNSVDNTAYDTVITEQAAIEQAKLNINQFPQFKTQLNNVITQYNVTMDAYKVYHNAGAISDSSSLQSQISSLVTNVATLIKSMIPVAPKL